MYSEAKLWLLCGKKKKALSSAYRRQNFLFPLAEVPIDSFISLTSKYSNRN
jgi:hypothetical protein